MPTGVCLTRSLGVRKEKQPKRIRKCWSRFVVRPQNAFEVDRTRTKMRSTKPCGVVLASVRRGALMSPHMLTPGDIAPVADLLDQDGTAFDWAGLRGQRALIFFYPKASTPGCTQQACALRDVVGQVGGTQIIGVSPDKPASQKKFADKNSLPYPLLADVDHELAEAFGVWKQKQNYGRSYMGIERSAFLIDADGAVENAWYKISPKDTPVKLLQALGA